MVFSRLMQSSRIRWRWLRYRASPWFALATVPLQWLLSPGVQRTDAEIRCMGAMGRINFVGVYGFLDDLLW